MSEFQVAICLLGDESYGLDIGTVYEIIRFQEARPVPTAPEHIDGVINLRGRVIPVMSLASKFGLPKSKPTNSTRIIVAGTEEVRIGLVVDAVTEVLMVPEDAVEQTPGVVSNSSYIKGIAKIGDELVILLDLSALYAEQIVIDDAA